MAVLVDSLGSPGVDNFSALPCQPKHAVLWGRDVSATALSPSVISIDKAKEFSECAWRTGAVQDRNLFFERLSQAIQRNEQNSGFYLGPSEREVFHIEGILRAEKGPFSDDVQKLLSRALLDLCSPFASGQALTSILTLIPKLESNPKIESALMPHLTALLLVRVESFDQYDLMGILEIGSALARRGVQIAPVLSGDLGIRRGPTLDPVGLAGVSDAQVKSVQKALGIAPVFSAPQEKAPTATLHGISGIPMAVYHQTLDDIRLGKIVLPGPMTRMTMTCGSDAAPIVEAFAASLQRMGALPEGVVIERNGDQNSASWRLYYAD